MSLTSHIAQGDNSPIGLFLRKHFPKTTSITKPTNSLLQLANTVKLDDSATAYHYGTLGTAIDYRIRYNFALTPSHELIAFRGAHLLPSWALESAEHNAVTPDEVMELLEAFFLSLDTTLARIQPVGRRLEVEEEQSLARYSYVLALFEQLYRHGLSPLILGGPLFEPAFSKSVDELLALPKDEWVADLCGMSWLFYESCSHLVSQASFLDPTFAGSEDVGGSDADLIVGGCLMEVKATINPMINPKWLRQLAGYLLLDYEDEYKINAIAIYMARQGTLFTWTVEEFLRLMTGDSMVSLASLRRDFRGRFGRARRIA